jgi:adenylate cyclase
MIQSIFRKHLSKSLVSLGFALLLVVIAGLQLFYPVQILFQDATLTTYEPGQQALVLGIDDAALRKYGSWPWSRATIDTIARELDELGARTVVYDILFSDKRPGDEELSKTFSKVKSKSVLATKVDEEGQLVELVPEIHNNPNIAKGLANLPRDEDGRVRHFDVLTQTKTSCLASLGVQAALTYLNQTLPAKCSLDGWSAGRTTFGQNTNNIDFAGRSGTIHTLSLADLGSPDKMRSVKNKIVFIGSTIQDLKLGLDDNILTPYGLIPGVEIQANIANQLLLARNLQNVPSWLSLGLMVLALLIIHQSALGLRPWQSSLLTITLIVIFYFLALILRQNGWILDFFLICLGLVVGLTLGLVHKFYLQNREHEYLKQVFGQYTDKQLLNKILEQGSVSLQGEKKFMTVLFTDLRDFTSLTESIEPERLAQLLNSYFTHSAQEIFATQGIVDKFIGDAIMALWNAILDDQEHVYHACSAAVRLVSTLPEFNQKNDTHLYNGVGIATGNMVVGNLGSQSRFEYTAIGDKVNLAARLEGLTKRYGTKILIDDVTYDELVRTGRLEEFKVRLVDEVQVKGRLSTVRVYEILADRFNPKDEAEICDWYAKAFKLYAKGDFENARSEFLQLGSQFMDQTSIVMARRCKELIQEPIENWRGIWSWQAK